MTFPLLVILGTSALMALDAGCYLWPRVNTALPDAAPRRALAGSQPSRADRSQGAPRERRQPAIGRRQATRIGEDRRAA